jgi:hypothetical protein
MPKTTLVILSMILGLALTPTLRAADAAPAKPKKPARTVRKPAKPKQAAPPAAASPTAITADKPATTPAAMEKGAKLKDWTGPWMEKYVIVTPKEGYVHVLLDTDTLYGTFQGNGAHNTMALQALNLAQKYKFAEGASDTVKLDVVHFKERDNYGAPQWDTLKRLARFEFTRKGLAQASAEAFAKSEADWKGLFQNVTFY